MRGRKPKPTALKLLDGNPGKRAIKDDEPKPAAAIMPAPRHLDKEAKAEWRRMMRLLNPLGLFTEIDKAALSTYCVAWSRHVAAEANVQKFGEVIVVNGNAVQSPYLSIANRAMEQLTRALAEFGMSPASRSRVTASDQETAANKWAGIL